MIINSNGPVYKQSKEAPEAVKEAKADNVSTEPIEAPEEAPVAEETPKVEPKKSGSKKKATKSKDK